MLNRAYKTPRQLVGDVPNATEGRQQTDCACTRGCRLFLIQLCEGGHISARLHRQNNLCIRTYFVPSGGPPGAWPGAGGRLTGSQVPGGPGGGRGGGEGGNGGSGPLAVPETHELSWSTLPIAVFRKHRGAPVPLRFACSRQLHTLHVGCGREKTVR